MHLVIDGRFLQQDVTGVQRVAVEFVNALDSLLVDGMYPDLSVDLVAPARGALAFESGYEAVALRRHGRLTGHAWEQVELPAMAKGSALLCLGNVAPVALLLEGRPVFTMVHDLSFRYFPQAYSRRFRLLYNTLMPMVLARSRVVFTVSESEKAAILKTYGNLIAADRLVVAQNGTARTETRPPRAEMASPPALSARSRQGLYVGSLTARKNAAGLLEAAVVLAREDDMDWAIVGGMGASFEQTGLRVPEDVRHRITFLGQLNDPEQLDALYRRASVFVFPSFYEASPLPPLEAMSHGCPVVAADIPSLRERCGDAALFCDPRDVGSIVTQARRLLNEPDTWKDFQLRGLARAARFSWQSQVRTVLEAVLEKAD
jgi:glycosyltransferase involved in cell wall biosynthesis